MIRQDLVFDQILGRILSFFTESFGGNRGGSTWVALTHVGEFRLLGATHDAVLRDLDVDATVFGPFVTYGLIGGFFAYLHVLLFAMVPVMETLKHVQRQIPRTYMPQIFLLLALNLFQRPFTLHFLYYVYLVALFDWEWRKYAAVDALAHRAPATAVAC